MILLTIAITFSISLIALYIALIKSENFLYWFDDFIDPAREWIYNKLENKKTEE